MSATVHVIITFSILDLSIPNMTSTGQVSSYLWESIPIFANTTWPVDRIRSLATRSEFMCSTVCLATTGCVAFFYNGQTESCHLHSSVYANKSSALSSPGSKFFTNVCMKKRAYKYNASLRKYYLPFVYPVPVKSSAEKACKNVGGTLINLSKEYEFSAMRNIINATVTDKQNTAFWVGAHRNSKTGHYEWNNGLEVKHNFWVSWQVGQIEGCVLMMPYFDSKLGPFACNHSVSLKIYPLCECDIN